MFLAIKKKDCQRSDRLLTRRQRDILKWVVESYISYAKPVSSNNICDALKCSSATVRNDMVHLEEQGLLEKAHYASGRIPSEEGYRYYVSHLMKPKDMSSKDMYKLQTIFHNQTLDLSNTIKKSIEIISEITNYTTIVLGKASEINKLKQIEVVPIEAGKILTLVITDKGHIEHKNITLPLDIEPDDIVKTVNLINKLLIGTPINEISEKLEYDVKPVIGRYVKQHEILYNTFYNAFNEFTTNTKPDVYFEGRNNFLKQPEFTNIDKVRKILEKFEDINDITKITNEENGINIYIGKESEITDDVSVVKTNYNIDGELVTIAIVGPKRMEYDRVVSILNYMRDNITDTGGNNNE